MKWTLGVAMLLLVCEFTTTKCTGRVVATPARNDKLYVCPVKLLKGAEIYSLVNY